MVKEGLKLVRYDFDALDNSSAEAISCTELGIFVDDSDLTAFKKIKDFLSNMPNIHPYLGWNKVVYPLFKVVEVEVR